MAQGEHAEPQNRNVSICFGSPIGHRRMLGRSSMNLILTLPLPILPICVRNLFISVIGAFASDELPVATFSLDTNIVFGPRVCE
jgi:hypothetical protein